MRILAKLALAPFVATVVLLAALERLVRGRRRPLESPAHRLAALREGMTIGVLAMAVVSLLVMLFSDSLGMSARLLPWFAALPLAGGYMGAALGFHFGVHEPDRVDEG